VKIALWVDVCFLVSIVVLIAVLVFHYPELAFVPIVLSGVGFLLHCVEQAEDEPDTFEQRIRLGDNPVPQGFGDAPIPTQTVRLDGLSTNPTEVSVEVNHV